MPRKYNLTVDLSAYTAKEVSSSPEKFRAFLKTAANNYKYSFDDQILIFAQKPGATACAEVETWNRLGRWVNKGTKGIALLVDRNVRYRMRYVFDISDTNSYYGHDVELWKYEEKYSDQVIEALENSFGEVEHKLRFDGAIMSIAEEVVQDNYSDYLEQLAGVAEGSTLGSLDSESVESEFRELLVNCVAYETLTRCGYDADRLYGFEDFDSITDFNTPETLSVIGNASSDISEMVLREIEATVQSASLEERADRTFAEKPETADNIGEEKEITDETERREENGTDLQAGGRPSDPEPRSAGKPEDRQIWDASAPIPERSQESDLHGDADIGQADEPSGEDRPGGDRDGGEADRADGEGAGSGREAESDRADEVGRADELPESLGGGDSPQRTRLQLSGHDFNVRSEIPYYYAPEAKNELIRNCPALKNHRKEITAFFESHEDRRERGDFIKGFFDETFVEHILESDERVGYRAYDDLLHIWHGSYLSRDKEDFLPWWRVAAAIEGQMLLGTWLSDDEADLFTVDGQMQLIAEQGDKSQFTVPQAAIDYVLTRGSGISQGKLRIYEQFQKQETTEKNIAFLKNEYGTGGYSDPIPESGYWEQHDGKGIELRKGGDKLLLPWNKVAKRIGELIAADRYLNRLEKEAYPEYLRDKEEREIRYQFAGRFNDLVEDFNDYETQIGNDTILIDRYRSREFASLFGQGERVIHGYGRYPDEYVLPALRDILERIISENTHLTDRAQELLDELDGTDMAKPFELTEAEKNPPPEPKKELRFSLGDKVYIGSKDYEILSLDDPVLLFDPQYPILTVEMPREEFYQKAAENPLNDNHLVVVDEKPEQEQSEAGECRIYIDQTNGTVRWIEYGEDPDNGPQYTTHTATFSEFLDVAESYPLEKEDNLPVFIEEITDIADEDIQNDHTPDLIFAEAEYDSVPDYVGLTRENLQKIYERVESALTDKEAEKALNAHEAEYGADGTRVFREVPHTSGYDLGYGHLGNGITVWNRLETVNGDYKTVAHIAPDRSVTIYDEDMPEEVRVKIFDYAENGDPDISATQQGKVFDDRSDEKLPAYDRSTEILYSVLHALKMDDVGLDFEDEDIVAFDEENRWKGKELFRFLIDECFVFEGEGHVVGISDEELADFTALAEYYGVPVIDNRLNKVWRDYAAAEFENPGRVVLFRIGDFYEVLGDRAKEVSDALDLTLTGRDVGIGRRVPMCGFPTHVLEAYKKKLELAGINVVLANEEREAASPHERYANTDEEIETGQESDLDRAKRLIDEYCQKEFGMPAGFDSMSEDDMKEIGLAYTTVGDAEIETQVNANLIDLSIDRYLGGVLIERWVYDSMREMCDVLENLDFNELTDYTDEQIERGEKERERKTAQAEPEKVETPQTELAPPPKKVKRDLAPHILYPEIKSDYRTNFKIEKDDIGVGTPLERFHHNVMAIQLLHKLENEHRLADTNEQRILSDYVGWGGLAEFFDEDNPHYSELRAVLSDNELASTRASTLTAFYTPPVVIKSIYQALENMGFKNGNILDPAGGIGNFMGLSPDSMSESKIY